ncbi:unnamed protein product [Orchesella dallaii]|uniref:DUF4789 domain-containing protein n=1 Tax=Orchesella dallaii TaxID=48710 RepID=A0ABP1Q9Y4_9HEXA
MLGKYIPFNQCHYCVYLLLFFITETVILVSSQNDVLDYEDSDRLNPGCPLRGSETFLRYKNDNRCYKANSQGPCPENMILFPHPFAKTYGFCDCFDARGDTTAEIAFLNNRNLTHCIPAIRAQVYVPERNRCYSVFDQGPCSAGKWLVLNATNYPICAKNTCTNPNKDAPRGSTKDPLSSEFVFALSSTSKCYRTMSQGYCAKSYELRFTSHHYVPQCRYISPTKLKCPAVSSTPEVRTIRCKPGSRYDYLANCSSSINPR